MRAVHKSPALWLLPLFVALLWAAWWVPWRSLISCDCRTYLEMIRGVHDHGLPYTENGPAAEYAELRARWNTEVDGKLWGMYGPVFAYVAAPAYALDGVRGVLRFNFVLLGVMAAVFYRLARRLTDDVALAVAAPYLLVFATPVAGLAHAVSAYTLVPLLMTAAAYFLCGATSRRNAALGGVLFGLAVSTHVMVGPLVLPLVVVVWRYRRQPVPALLVGLLVGLLPTIGINLVRYGSANPLAAAPCLWASCASTGVDHQNLGALVKFAGLPALVVAASAVGVWLLRRRGPLVLIPIAIGIALLLIPPSVRRPTLLVLRLAMALVFDIGVLQLGASDFARPADGRGYLLLNFAIKAGLQSSPLLLIGVMARPQQPIARFAAALAASLIATLIVVLALRAEMMPAYAIGFPILHLRYLFPILPFAIVLVVLAMEPLTLRPFVLGLSVFAAALLIAWLWRGVNDLPPLRRLVILRATLAAAGLALVGAKMLRMLQRNKMRAIGSLLLVPALALSLAVTIGVDVRGWIHLRNQYEQTMQRLARLIPPRAAFIAHAVTLDPALGMLPGRDLEYADFYESKDPGSLRKLIQHWFKEGRPVFAVVGSNRLESPYPELRYRVIDRAAGLVQITSIEDPP